MLFDAPPPHVFATPLGVDFCAALIAGLDARMGATPPEALARVEIHVANARMQRRLQALYMQRGPGLLPHIRPVLGLAQVADLAGLPPPVSPLRLRLDLSQLVGRLLDRNPDLAPRSALYALSDSLADLMGEMFEEGVSPATVAALDVAEHSRHWDRAQQFLGIVATYFAADAAPTAEARQARIVDRLIADWALAPPAHPVIVAGSTGSRGATLRLMQAVARLPQGAVVLPGLDGDMPESLWRGLMDGRHAGLAGEDHPQYRLAKFASLMGLLPGEIWAWSTDAPPSPARNRLISLALRPAPVTDQWREEGPRLAGLAEALAGVTLLEAPTPQAEATAIALRLRQAAEDGQRAALVTSDRRLTRQVRAALDRWRITPDDSAGEPLGLTAGGRFLRQVAEALCGPVSSEALVALLKHPLCHSGKNRLRHLDRTRALEVRSLRGRIAFPTRAKLMEWAETRTDDAEAMDWAAWVAEHLLTQYPTGPIPLADRVAQHVARADALAAGVEQVGAGMLYDKDQGAELARLVADLTAEAGAGGEMTARDYADFFTALAADREARQALRPHADILIWGTQEARVQGADLTILAGLNEGMWPRAPEADPWLNRAMRAEAGLRLPDRVIGLSAHDFQQGVAAREVWLCRAIRDDETDTVPSRWLNRLVNLLDGASAESNTALQGMRARGTEWVGLAEALATPAAQMRRAPRPAPAPRSGPRLTRMSVTEVERLVRDPYAIYAKHLLGLKRLEPLRQLPDAALRGTVTHRVFERFGTEFATDLPPDAAAELMRIADEVLIEEAPWPAARRLWRARLLRVVPWVLEREAELRAKGTPWRFETRADWPVPGLDLNLTGRPDRIDRRSDGAIAIFDYKTGSVPTEAQEAKFNRQLWLLAMIAEGGGFGEAMAVSHIAYVGLGAKPEMRGHDVTPADIAETADGLRRLVAHYRQRDVGFPSRRSVVDTRWEGDYDHLARLGEWDETEEALVIPVGRT